MDLKEFTSRSFSKEIAMLFGIMSILFALVIPPAGFLFGVLGFYYEQKSAKEKADEYSVLNLSLNAIGIIIAVLMIIFAFYFGIPKFLLSMSR